MNVGELIAKLQAYNPKTPVFTDCESGSDGDYHQITTVGVDEKIVYIHADAYCDWNNQGEEKA